MLFLTAMLNQPVFDARGARLGWVDDLVLTGMTLFPSIEALVLARRGQGAAFVPWRVVERADTRGVVLTVPREDLPLASLHDEAIFLRRDILDKQVVDIHGRRVVRINDLQLAPVQQELRLVGADIGARGLLRRLNLEHPVNAAARWLHATLPERVIPWNYVEGLQTDWPSIRLNVSHRRLRDLPATDIAAIVVQLHPDDREGVLQLIDDETLADTLPHLEEDLQAEVLESLPDKRASDILEILPPDEAADVLGELDEKHAERLLHLMEPDDADDLRELLRYDDDTAGGLMTTEFLAFADRQTVDETLALLRQAAPDAETIYYLYVVDERERLEGVLSLRDLLNSAGDTPIGELAERDVIRVNVHDDQETAARVLNHYHLLAVPVVDDDGVLRGIVTVDDVLDVMIEEAGEDMSRHAGAVEESNELGSPWRQTLLRLPWTLGAGGAGVAVAAYLTMPGMVPSNIATALALLPIMMLLAANLGGQAAAVAQVALAEQEHPGEIVRQLWRGQWPIGAILSVLAGALSGALLSRVAPHAPAMLMASLVTGIILAVVMIGGLLPLLLARLRWDPAFVNRPTLAALTLLLGVALLSRVI